MAKASPSPSPSEAPAPILRRIERSRPDKERRAFVHPADVFLPGRPSAASGWGAILLLRARDSRAIGGASSLAAGPGDISQACPGGMRCEEGAARLLNRFDAPATTRGPVRAAAPPAVWGREIEKR
ncbi:uncharacterized protein PV09_01410 [Verruconis gallopava]|uniref:Uncharacterized protein n=1 Tax=Verruconis gallopava TaxID=253628 RepID=A0A0D2APV8_9PEZI|nr:uncharacterized protein PV09_01410 [Verruconis gallopava]KIW08520.1 hypothetical protein PV09_01410 [Verruconis gallopava]